MAAGLAACGGGGDRISEGPRTTKLPTSTPASAPASNAPSAKVSQGTPGQSLTSGDSRVTVYAWEQPAAVDLRVAVAPMPGNEFAAADAEQCAPDAASTPVNASTYGFRVVGTDNVSHSPEPSWRKPDFKDVRLFAGDCVRGWVTFQVPVGQRPSYLEWHGTTSLTDAPLRWRLS